MAIFSQSISPRISDVKFNVVIHFESTEDARKAIKDNFQKVKNLLRQDAPFPDGFEYLADLKQEDLLFDNIEEDFYDEGVSVDCISDYMGKLSVTLQEVMGSSKDASFRGAVYMPVNYMGSLRAVYFLSCIDEGDHRTYHVELYSASHIQDPDFDIEKEIDDWFEGRNPRRAEIAQENAERRNGVDSERPENSTVVAETSDDDPYDFPTFMMSLLSDDWMFFNDAEIDWDGAHHQLTGIEINAAKYSGLMAHAREFADDYDDAQDIANYLMAFMRELEKDDGLMVPREMIAPGVQVAIREGDLTGITLANLAACGAAIRIVRKGNDEYMLFYDTRLANGIPCFFDLMARLIWDGRQMTRSMSGRPFKVFFGSTRNFDADQCLDSVDAPVAGAQKDPMVMNVDYAPSIELPEPGEKPSSDVESDSSEIDSLLDGLGDSPSIEEMLNLDTMLYADALEKQDARSTEEPEGDGDELAQKYSDEPSKDGCEKTDENLATKEAAKDNAEAERAVREKAVRERQDAALVKVAAGLTGRSRAVYDVVDDYKGGLDLMLIASCADIRMGPEDLFYSEVKPLMDKGLLVEYMETTPGGRSDTRCRRYYTWRQTRLSSLQGRDKSDYIIWAKDKLSKLRCEDQEERARNRIEKLEKELDACSLFSFSKKDAIRREIDEEKASLDEISKKAKDNEEIIEFLSGNVIALSR